MSISTCKTAWFLRMFHIHYIHWTNKTTNKTIIFSSSLFHRVFNILHPISLMANIYVIKMIYAYCSVNKETWTTYTNFKHCNIQFGVVLVYTLIQYPACRKAWSHARSWTHFSAAFWLDSTNQKSVTWTKYIIINTYSF